MQPGLYVENGQSEPFTHFFIPALIIYPPNSPHMVTTGVSPPQHCPPLDAIYPRLVQLHYLHECADLCTGSYFSSLAPFDAHLS